MKKMIMIGIIGIVLMTTTVTAYKADQIFDFLITEDLSVTDDMMVGDQLRINGNEFHYGEIRINDQRGYTGTCYGHPIIEEGLIIGCTGE